MSFFVRIIIVIILSVQIKVIVMMMMMVSGESRSVWSKVGRSLRLHFTPEHCHGFYPHAECSSLIIMVTIVIIVIVIIDIIISHCTIG